MFSYFGSKSKIAKYYPAPVFDRIIEPFAGSARYSLLYFEKDILLVDKYQAVIDVWHFLQECSTNDILSLPKLRAGMKISELNLSEKEKLFLGFLAGRGSISPRNTVSPRSDFSKLGTPNLYKNIANNLHKIKHWKIKKGDYKDIDNDFATWFIDPPYQFGGQAYKESNKKIDYLQLKEWCLTRNGQIIVCENSKANWIETKPLKTIQGVANTFTIESIYTNYASPQQLFFF